MTHRPRIVVVGSLVMDFVAQGPRLPQAGETILGERFGMFPGGKGANQAVAAARLGAEVYLVGCIGSDVFGESLIASLKESGVDTQFVRVDETAKTAACCIHVDAQGNNSIIIVPEANSKCSPADVERALEVIEACDVLVCQLEIPIATVERAVGLATTTHVATILNPAPARELPRSLISCVRILTPNESEAATLVGSATTHGKMDERSLARALLATGVKSVVVTLAERGAFVATSDIDRLVPAFAVQSTDTTAAGDAFNGALAVALAEEREFEDAVRFANAAGALATTRAGAQPSLPWRSEVEALLGANR